MGQDTDSNRHYGAVEELCQGTYWPLNEMEGIGWINITSTFLKKSFAF